jgi:Rrf2 family protein
MQLSATSKYAIKILAFMSNNKSQKYSSKALSEELGIPYKYLTRIMTKLSKNGLVISTQGKYGGFSIAKKLNEIKVIDIVVVFDDNNNKKCIIEERDCNFEDKCIMHDNWQKPKCAIDDFFTKTTLEDLQN